jgi:hypothetical protein
MGVTISAFYDNETIMGFGFPREERAALVAAEPEKFLLPRPSDLRYRWVCVRLDAIEVDELRGLLVDAWRIACRRGGRQLRGMTALGVPRRVSPRGP